jgi:hypothetical protein
MTILDTNPDDYLSLADREEEERAITLLAMFIDKVWARFDNEEPSIDDYYNYM